MTDDYSDIEERLQRATFKPWSYFGVESISGGSIYDRDVIIAEVLWDSSPVDGRIRRTRTVEEADRNGDLIAHAPTDITRLLQRVRELEAEKSGWSDAAWKAAAEVSALETQRDAALAIHRRGMIYTSGSTDPKHEPSTEFRCTDDHLLWPCATVKALGGNRE